MPTPLSAASDEQVIIAGAGPVGLWLAGELALAGVPVLVLERAAQRSPFSKALGVHPRTVEVLAMRGAAQPLLAAGRPMPSWHFGMLDQQLDFRVLDTAFPFMLAYPQARLEEVLEQRAVALGARIVRGVTVTGLTQDSTSVTVETTGGGAYRAAFVVGCDGAGSTVRTAAGIKFPGTEATTWGYVSEVSLDDPPGPGMRAAHNAAGSLILVPMAGGGFRIAGVDLRHQRPDDTFTLEDLRGTTTAVAGRDFGMRDATWLSRFSNATRVAAAYRRGRVLLAGDAAHMHFPAGGVGLNVGVQDAMNLGWKLAAVLQSRASDALLDTYHSERHPVGLELAEHTLAQTALITAATPDGEALRALLGGLIATQPAFSLALARKIAALDVTYPPLAVAAGEGTAGADVAVAHPLAGHRVPLDADSLEALASGRAVLVGLGGELPEAAAKHAAARGIEACSGSLIEAAGPEWSGVGAVLVRPDGYAWWAADGPTASLGPAISHALFGLSVRF